MDTLTRSVLDDLVAGPLEIEAADAAPWQLRAERQPGKSRHAGSPLHQAGERPGRAGRVVEPNLVVAHLLDHGAQAGEVLALDRELAVTSQAVVMLLIDRLMAFTRDPQKVVDDEGRLPPRFGAEDLPYRHERLRCIVHVAPRDR